MYEYNYVFNIYSRSACLSCFFCSLYFGKNGYLVARKHLHVYDVILYYLNFYLN